MQVTKHNDKVYIISDGSTSDKFLESLTKLENIEFITPQQALEMGITTEPTRRAEIPIVSPIEFHQPLTQPLTRAQRRKQSRLKTLFPRHH